MKIQKATFIAIIGLSALITSPIAHAASAPASLTTSSVKTNSISSIDVLRFNTLTHADARLYGSSSTATSFFKRGMKRFEDGKLDQAEQAFEAVLRANGSKKMDKLTLHYLSHINYLQGEHDSSKQYAQAYVDLIEK